MIYSSSARVRGPVEDAQARARPARALLAVGGRRLLVPPGGGTIGRSRDCDVVLDDAGVSRRHAEIRPGPGGWTVADLGSTNGVRVNGADVHGAQALQPGDRVELGSTEIVFEALMNTLAPVSVALKFGFLAVLYLFLLWVARSARRDLRGSPAAERERARGRANRARSRRTPPGCTPPRRLAAPPRPPRATARDRARARSRCRG